MRDGHAVLRLALDGTVLDANVAALDLLGYQRSELVGSPHAVLVDERTAASDHHARFWAGLQAGLPASGDYERVRRDGRTIWIRCTYAPSFDSTGRVAFVTAYATDVTAERQRQAELRSQLRAIQDSQCVLTLDMAGAVIDASAPLLAALDYEIDAVRGRHHRMFVEPSYAHGPDYAAFWRELAAGRPQSGQYCIRARGDREVWLNALYTPIRGADGIPTKIVAFATVVTDDKLLQAYHQGQIAAITKSQCVIAFDLEGRVIDANDKFLDLMGFRFADVRGRHHRMFCSAEQIGSSDYAAFWKRLARGESESGVFKRIGIDGREVWLQATYNPIFDMNGRPFQVVKYATDVTAQKLRDADCEGQIAAINTSQGVVSMDLDGTIRSVNASFLATLGYEPGELEGRHHSVLVEPDEAASPSYQTFWAKLRAGTFVSGMHKRIGKGGRELWIRATYNPIFDLNGRPYKIVKYATDVTSDVALAAAFEDAKRQAQCDPATTLPNRTRLAGFLGELLGRDDARVAVLYLDLDRFKPINDAFGHGVGDRVLGEVADRFRRMLVGDQMVARVGGDEFVLVAPDADDDEVALLCQRLIAAVAEPIRHEDQELSLSLSIGVAVSPADGATADELIGAADRALGRSKRNGRRTFTFSSAEADDRLGASRRLGAEIRRGLPAGEFVLEYQPRFHLHSRQVRSFEALVRWDHPERGRIGPGEFIPCAERRGLIFPLGEAVLRMACRTAAGWDGIGVSVNVSPVQFRDDRLVPTVLSALAESGLAPERLELEITEGVLLDDAERARHLLEELKSHGVRLAIDDFGTGFSSLNYLRTFPFDVIKIDRSFVADMEGTKGGKAIVAAILGLGRALGLSVTAEGVETANQLDMLSEAQCAEAQGFLLGRPMPTADIPAFLLRVAEETLAAPAPARLGLVRPIGRHPRRGEPASLSA